MRKFWIRNAKGQEFDMNREDAFFSSPKGLGIARKTTYTQIGYNWIEKEGNFSQKKPSGNMVFDGYEQYDEFVSVIQHTPLVLMYQPLNTVYYMDVNCFSLEKGEMNYKDTFLTCKITFDGVTPWYTAKRIVRKENALEGKVYAYQYPYIYTDSASGEAEIVNNSGWPAYCRLKLYGPLENPVWRLTQYGEMVSDGRMLSKIEKDACVVIDSNPSNLEIMEYDLLEQPVKDRYEESDFKTNRFLYIPPGASRLKVSHAGASDVRFLAEVTEIAG